MRSRKFGIRQASVAVLLSVLTVTAAAQKLKKLSSDPFTNSESQHATEVEPDTFAFGNR